MSNTPITDANLWVGIHGCLKTKNTGGKGYVHESIARELETKLIVANDRIKRLEEAGDRLAGTTPPSSDRYMAWIKAKEAKP